MPLPKLYAHQLPVALTASQHAHVETKAAGGSLAAVVRDAVDLQIAVDSGHLVTLTPLEFAELTEAASQLMPL